MNGKVTGDASAVLGEPVQMIRVHLLISASRKKKIDNADVMIV